MFNRAAMSVFSKHLHSYHASYVEYIEGVKTREKVPVSQEDGGEVVEDDPGSEEAEEAAEDGQQSVHPHSWLDFTDVTLADEDGQENRDPQNDFFPLSYFLLCFVKVPKFVFFDLATERANSYYVFFNVRKKEVLIYKFQTIVSVINPVSVLETSPVCLSDSLLVPW